MSKPSKVMIVAPFWGQSQHVGVYRIDRFIRWLSAGDVKIVLVRAGSADYIREKSWGIEVTVRDPFGFYIDPEAKASTPMRRPNRLRRLAAYLLFNPDPSVVWAKRVVQHPIVLKEGQGVSWVLSSSPPESPHVASFLLAKCLHTDLIVDLRDGWLDEPLKPLLRNFPLQRWREGRLEARILRKAKHIFVSSDLWKNLLEQRLPFTRGKTTVLTNGYPPGYERLGETGELRASSERITLLYAGRFSSSAATRKARYLLEPLLRGILPQQYKGHIILLGSFEPQDLTEVDYWKPRFEALNWSLEVRTLIPREEMMKLLCQADGLLLLSASQAAIPSKLFEYLPARRPILALTPSGSAVWRMADSLPQVFLLDYSHPQKGTSIVYDFLAACATGDCRYLVPPDFTETRLSQIFLREIEVEEDKLWQNNKGRYL